MLSSEVQLLNAYLSISVTVVGNVMLLSSAQSLKMLLGILVIPSLKVAEVKPLL